MSAAIRSRASASCMSRIGQVERREQLGLVGDLVRRHEDAAHRRERARRLDVACPRDVQRGVDAERPVEVEVELGLGHRADEGAQRALIGCGHGAMVCGIGVGRRTAPAPPLVAVTRWVLDRWVAPGERVCAPIPARVRAARSSSMHRVGTTRAPRPIAVTWCMNEHDRASAGGYQSWGDWMTGRRCLRPVG